MVILLPLAIEQTLRPIPQAMHNDPREKELGHAVVSCVHSCQFTI